MFDKLQACKLSQINNYKHITNIVISIILITTTIGIWNQFKHLKIQMYQSELSISSLNNLQKLNKLINSIQKERGLSTIYTVDQNKINLNKLKQQRKISSLYINNTQNASIKNQDIKDIRNKIIKKLDTLNASKYDVFNDYTNLIQKLFHIQYKHILNIENDFVKNKLFFNRDINMLQELIGQLRADIGYVLESKKITIDDIHHIRHLNTLLENNLNKLKLYDRYKQHSIKINKLISSSNVQDTLLLINTIIDTKSINSVDLSAIEWFDLSTITIDKLNSFTIKNLNTIYKDIKQMKDAAYSDFMFNMFLWFGGFIGLVVLFIISYKKSIELKKQHDMLIDYKKAVDHRTIISKTNPKGIITYANEEFCKVSGYSEDELLNKNHNIIRHKDMPKEAFREMWEILKSGQTWEGRVKNRKKDGGFYWVNATITPVFDEKGSIKEYIAMRYDITDIVLLNEELKKTQKQLKEQAIRDPLTNLYNRRHLQDISQDLIHLSKRQKNSLSIIMLDIDKFKLINDTYGHNIGDNVIIDLANTLKKHTRKSDIIARIGGEEFVILLPNTNKDGALNIAEFLRNIIENSSVDIDELKSLNYTISMGVSIVDSESEKTVDKALQQADKALYKAKNGGRNKIEIL